VEIFEEESKKIDNAKWLAQGTIYPDVIESAASKTGKAQVIKSFPGPGLGVRILGEVKKEYADLLREADDIFMQELYATGWYEKTSQAFAVFLPVKSVGVVGDNRAYDWVIALRAVQTIDFMTATWAHIPYDILGHISNRIINEVRGIFQASLLRLLSGNKVIKLN